MPKKQQSAFTYQQWLQDSSVRIGRILFIFVSIYIAIVVLYDAFNLITPDMLLGRWIAASILLVLAAILWYIARSKNKSEMFYSRLIYTYIFATLLFASFNIYYQRGMASRAVFLYVIPILIAAFLLRRAAIFMTAAIAVAAYSLTAIWYSTNFPSEGYKIEIYGEVGFYSALFFVVAALAWGIVRSKTSDSS